jgi:alpha-N-arabinofuranosidase
MAVEIDARSFGTLAVSEALQLADGDLSAVNTKEEPDRVRPEALDDVRLEGNRIHANLRPASWNIVSLGAG